MTLNEFPEVKACVDRALNAMRDASESMEEFEASPELRKAAKDIAEAIYALSRQICSEKKRLREVQS